MSSAGRALRGLRLAGRGAAFPSDLELGAGGPRSLDGAAAWQLLLGPDWRGELARRGWDADHPRRAWGVAARQWLHRPGAHAQLERGTERLAVGAARAALDDARVEARELDLVVVATSTPDRIGATLAARVAAELGSGGACFDLRAGGAGGVLAWIAAAQWLAGGARRALVVASETISAYLQPGEPALAMLFGDGAAALVLERDERAEGGLAAWVALREPAAGRAFTVPGPLPVDAAHLERGGYRLQAPDAAYLAALEAAWSRLAGALATELAGLPPAPRRLLAGSATRAAAERFAGALALDPRDTLESLAAHGACGAAAPLLALARAAPVAAGEQLVLAGMGGGIHAAGLVWQA